MMPLLVYLIVKWHEIRDVFSEIGIVMESNDSNIGRTRLKGKEVIYLPLKLSYENSIDDKLFSLLNHSSQENSTQTDTLHCSNKSIQTTPQYRNNSETSTVVKFQDKISQTDAVLKINRSIQTTAQNLEESSSNTDNENSKIDIKKTCPLANSTAILPDGDLSDTCEVENQKGYSYFTAPEYTSKYYSIVNTENCIGDFTPRGKESELLDQTPYSFFSAMNTPQEWSNTVKETSKIVDKMEEYIYDDYDTFAKEGFNQLFDKSKLSL